MDSIPVDCICHRIAFIVIHKVICEPFVDRIPCGTLPSVQRHAMQQFRRIVRHIAGRCNIFGHIELRRSMHIERVLQRMPAWFQCRVHHREKQTNRKKWTLTKDLKIKFDVQQCCIQ